MTDPDSHDPGAGTAEEGDINPIGAFRQELDSLVINSKPHILMLTMLADDFKEVRAMEVVDCIEKRLMEVTQDKKLPTLYLIDSICKNLTQSAYVFLFQQKIIRIFCHTFERADDKTRVLLFKLRQTWSEVFQHDVMHQLDLAVKKIDPGWPVVKASTGGKPSSEAHRKDDGKLNKSPKANPSIISSNLPTVKSITLIENHLMAKPQNTQQIELQLKNQLLEKMSNGQKSPIAASSRHESTGFGVDGSGSGRIPKCSKSTSIKSEPKRKSSWDQNCAPAKIPRRDSSSEKPNNKNTSPNKKILKKEKSASSRRRGMVESPTKLSKNSKNTTSQELPVPLPPIPDDVIPLGSSHHQGVAKRTKPDRRNESSPVVAAIKSRRSPPIPRRRPNQTTIPAPNVFAQPEMLFNIPKVVSESKPLDTTADSWNNNNNNQSSANSVMEGFGMDRDYRHEFGMWHNQVPAPMPPPPPSSQPGAPFGAFPPPTHALPTVPQMPGHQFVPYEHQVPPQPLPMMPAEPSPYGAPPSQPPAAYPIDINGLLSKLTASGLLSNNTNSNNVQTTSEPAVSALPSTNQGGKSHGGKGKRSRKQQQAKLPKQYLTLDAASLKTSHQFAIDQLYSGTQCTNCSLRFSDDALKEEVVPGEKNKKSRYARHLDWHFRQNRREKAKPTSGGGSTSNSAAVAHRRPWYYSIDLWILYKEVNDDIEEDSAGFFDANAVNSPSMLGAAGGSGLATIDFAQFKDSISDFDAFMETITSDSSAAAAVTTTTDNSTKGCTVVAEAGVTDISCAVCNEVLEQKWHEEEEEWRLMNAVRFHPDDDPSASRIYHPLCLKDYLIQREKAVLEKTEADSPMDTDNSDGFLSKSDAIPALDIVKEEEPDSSIVSSSSSSVISQNVLIPGLDVQVKLEEPETNEQTEENGSMIDGVDVDADRGEEDEAKEEIVADENSTIEAASAIEEQDVDVKVVEYEIPIAPLLKSESTDLSDDLQGETTTSLPAAAASATAGVSTLSESTLGDTTAAMNSPKRVVAAAETESHSPSSKTQPKRGGIVIKMKKSTTTTSASAPSTLSTAASEAASSPTVTDSSGNVLASGSDSAFEESEHSSGLQSKPETISTSKCDNKVDVADLSDDACPSDGRSADAPAGLTSGGAPLCELDEEVRHAASASTDGTLSPANGEVSLDSGSTPRNGTSSVGGHESLTLPSADHSAGQATEADAATSQPTDSTSAEATAKPVLQNYYSRGNETSSLCRIM